MTGTGSNQGERGERRGRTSVAKGSERCYVFFKARDRVAGTLFAFGCVI